MSEPARKDIAALARYDRELAEAFPLSQPSGSFPAGVNRTCRGLGLRPRPD